MNNSETDSFESWAEINQLDWGVVQPRWEHVKILQKLKQEHSYLVEEKS